MKRQTSFEGRIVAVKKNEAQRGGGMKEGTSILNFYWERNHGKIWLFSQRYTSGVHKQFQNGLRDYDIRNYKKWNRNPRLDKTMKKIPMYVAYASRELV